MNNYQIKRTTKTRLSEIGSTTILKRGEPLAIDMEALLDEKPVWKLVIGDGTHVINDLQPIESGVYIDGEWYSIETLLDAKAPLHHTHGISDLSGVAKESHTHTIDDLSGVAPTSHSHTISDITGTVPFTKGGTGTSTALSNASANSIIKKNGSTASLTGIATKSGALYATSADGSPSFGTLPIAQGGTGATSKSAILSSLGLGATISSIDTQVSGRNNWTVINFTNGFVIACDTWTGNITLGNSFGNSLYYLSDTWTIPSGIFTSVYSATCSYAGPGIVCSSINTVSATGAVCSLIGSDSLTHESVQATLTIFGFNSNKVQTVS